MEVVHERCCGLDVHAKTVVACLIVPGPDDKPSKEIRTFGTMTENLLRLRDWLVEVRCPIVAMESTGVYWKPIYNLLEGTLELLVVNAQHITQVPGRKSDVRDCEWIANLLRHGLLTASFIPDREQRELRELTRYRTSLVRERSAELNRLKKVLEGANIKLAVVTKDMMGTSAREMLQALVAGRDDSATMAELARGRLRAKIPQLEQALAGRMGAHQRFLLAEQLVHIDFLDEQIDRVSAEIAERLRPFEQAITLLDTIPGVARRGAEVLVVEIGVEMHRFPTAAHLASWAGMAPGNNESAGKRRSGKTRWRRSVWSAWRMGPWRQSGMTLARDVQRPSASSAAWSQRSPPSLVSEPRSNDASMGWPRGDWKGIDVADWVMRRLRDGGGSIPPYPQRRLLLLPQSVNE